jgi:hypothetical protein
MELYGMVELNFTYNGVNYIGYETRSLYWMVDYPYQVQFFAYKTPNEVDTIFVSVIGTMVNRDDVINEGIELLTNS